MTKTVICMKWGRRYGAEYANRLHAMVCRHVTGELRFVCFTDDASELDAGIEAKPLPPIDLPNRIAWTTWRKISVWQYPLADLEGEVLFLDLDLVITDSLDPFFTYEPGQYCVIRNWTTPRQAIGNTSVFRFPVGKFSHIYDRIAADPISIFRRYRIEQQYISGEIESQAFWPKDWCVSFKHSCLPPWPLNFVVTPRLPEGARLVAFTGRPFPDEAVRGRWPAVWWKKTYKHVRPTPWIAEHWR